MDARQLQRCSTSPYHEFLGERPGVDHQWESYSGAAAALKTKRLKIPLTITAAEACSTAPPLFFFFELFWLDAHSLDTRCMECCYFREGVTERKTLLF